MNPSTRFSILIGLQATILAVLIGSKAIKSQESSSLDINFYRDLAAKLHAAGIDQQAARYYEKYLEQGNLDLKTKAAIAFSMGELYENGEQLEPALASYYQVALLDAKSQYKDEAAKKIVALLERMKKFAAAKYELGAQTKLEEEAPQGAVVIAKIDGKNIYLNQLHEAIDQLPDYVKKSIDSAEGRANFAKKYVADELLYAKALRQNLDKEPKVAKQLASIQKQIYIQNILETELAGKVNIDPADVKNYFEANKTKYLAKGEKEANFEKAKSQVEHDYQMEKTQRVYQELLDETLKTNKVELFLDKIKAHS